MLTVLNLLLVHCALRVRGYQHESLKVTCTPYSLLTPPKHLQLFHFLNCTHSSPHPTQTFASFPLPQLCSLLTPTSPKHLQLFHCLNCTHSSPHPTKHLLLFHCLNCAHSSPLLHPNIYSFSIAPIAINTDF